MHEFASTPRPTLPPTARGLVPGRMATNRFTPLSGLALVLLAGCGGGGGVDAGAGGGGAPEFTPEANAFYATSGQPPGSGPSALYLVDPSAAGRDWRIGTVHTATGANPVMTDLARTPSGALFGISFGTLYRIDPTTALATPIGTGLGYGDVNALGSDAAGALIGATESGLFLAVSPTTGRAVGVGSLGAGSGSDGDVATSPAGVIFVALRGRGAGPSVLAVVHPSTGLAMPVAPGNDTGFEDVWGLSFVGSELLGLGRDPFTGATVLVRLDPSSGRGIALRLLSFTPFGSGKPVAGAPR